MTKLNVPLARFNMVEQQVRPWEVLDQQVLDGMLRVPREAFVPESYRKLAFADFNIPLGHQQVMMSPTLVGRLLQALALNPNDRVLEIGTGSGYLTALLATAAKHVDSVDIFAEFVSTAQGKLEELEIRNVSLMVGDAAAGWNLNQSYDVIVITGAVPVVPQACLRQLEEGGCLFAVVGTGPVMEAQLISARRPGEWSGEILFETWLPPLIGVSPVAHFVF